MEGAFDLKYGVAGLCILITIYILVRVGEFVWGLKEKKETATEATIQKLIATIEHLDKRIGSMEAGFAEVAKLKKDLTRCFAALRLGMGDKWNDIRKQIIEDDFPL